MLSSYDLKALEAARITSEMSLDPSTKVGVVIRTRHGQLYTGHNRPIWNLKLAPGVSLESLPREDRMAVMIHAEEDALSRMQPGQALGADLYVHGPMCCLQCARLVADAGIVRVISLGCQTPEAQKRWDRWNCDAAVKVLQSCGVKVELKHR